MISLVKLEQILLTRKIISHKKASQLSIYHRTSDDQDFAYFATTGGISTKLEFESKREVSIQEAWGRNAKKLYPLTYYIAHHGERPPVSNWSELKNQHWSEPIRQRALRTLQSSKRLVLAK